MTLRRASAAVLLLALASACAADDGGGDGADRTSEASEAVTITADGVAVRVEAGPESVLTAVVTVEAGHPVRPRLVATADAHVVEVPVGPVYSDFLGDADAIGDGHVLITHGAVVDARTALNTALIVEVDRATDDIVLSIRVPSGDGTGWQAYWAEHLDSWYPRVADRPLAGDPPLP